MKRVLVLVVGIVMLAVAGVAWSSHAPESSDPRDAVWGGGRFLLAPGFPRDFSMLGKEGRFGGAEGTLFYGTNGGGLVGRVEVQCVNVSGNHAVVAGTIRDSTNASWIGLTATFWVIDNGGPSSATRDQTSGIFLNPTPEDLAQFPSGYPNVCPSATEAPWGTLQYFDVVRGDLVVHDATD